MANEHSLRWLEQITVSLQRDQIINANNVSSQWPILSGQVLNQVYKVIINGCKVIKSYTQANKPFVCEQLIMAISEVLEQDKAAIKINKQQES